MDRESYIAETAEYRSLRDRLLIEEQALSDQTERVAALRRQLPSNPLPVDYVFREGPADIHDESLVAFREVRLSELFDLGHDTLIVQHVMYTPEDECPMCSMWADAFNGIAHHVRQRASFVLNAKAEIARFRSWGRRRGWTNIRLVSSHDSSFNRDFGFENEDGSQSPGLSVFTKSPSGELRHFYSVHARMTGEHWRGIDALSPVWNLLDLTPEGRDDWFPSAFYEVAPSAG
jgi:predicted dithiol-disulfide oxidoreductase (DUF899 family)